MNDEFLFFYYSDNDFYVSIVTNIRIIRRPGESTRFALACRTEATEWIWFIVNRSVCHFVCIFGADCNCCWCLPLPDFNVFPHEYSSKFKCENSNKPVFDERIWAAKGGDRLMGRPIFIRCGSMRMHDWSNNITWMLWNFPILQRCSMFAPASLDRRQIFDHSVRCVRWKFPIKYAKNISFIRSRQSSPSK